MRKSRLLTLAHAKVLIIPIRIYSLWNILRLSRPFGQDQAFRVLETEARQPFADQFMSFWDLVEGGSFWSETGISNQMLFQM
ncbi:hypothetical protein E6H14_07530 [Candidatus Bathyarchaeota archaeon]|nr:MAG: hypothetical protein E6H14_07530 [Candidatus Bathyarchaeota archaeon]